MIIRRPCEISLGGQMKPQFKVHGATVANSSLVPSFSMLHAEKREGCRLVSEIMCVMEILTCGFIASIHVFKLLSVDNGLILP